MLDRRVLETLLAYRAGRLSLEDAAQALARVQRETGCLTLLATPGSDAAERALVARVTALVRGAA